jgi:sugar lactone lactonase YvrE
VTQAECVHAGGNVLGESPIWSVRAAALFWVDSRGPAIYRLTPATGKIDTWKLPDPIGSIVLRAKGGLVAATRHGFNFVDLATGALTAIVDPESHLPNNRFNDGRCDHRGRYWSGTMSDVERAAVGTQYRLNPDLTVRAFKTGLVIPNATCWSPDGRTMYFGDTTKQTIWAYDYDLDTGTPNNERVFVKAEGRPDGATVDADGCVWSAEYGNSRVVRYTPQGKIDRTVSVPATSITSCAFGGSKLDTLYITTATQRLTPDDIKKQPLAGGLFAAQVGVTGVPEPEFGG